MIDTLITEDGNRIMMETVSGVTGVSSLNDVSVVTIFKENFDTNPALRGWLVGSLWEYDNINDRMKII